MPEHNASTDIIHCRKCGARKPRHKPNSRECHECHNARHAEYARKKYADPVAYAKHRAAIYEARKSDPAAARAKMAEWRAKNPDKLREYGKRHLAKANARRRRRRAQIPALRITDNIRRRVREVIAGVGTGKRSKRTAAILGRPLSDFADWAARQGGIPPDHEVDHIRPIKYFLQLYPDDPHRALREAYHFGNLRIIPRAENRQKNARRTHLC